LNVHKSLVLKRSYLSAPLWYSNGVSGLSVDSQWTVGILSVDCP